MYSEITKWLIILTVILWISWDIFALVKGGIQATISRNLIELSKQYPIIPFAVGLLIGHLYG